MPLKILLAIRIILPKLRSSITCARNIYTFNRMLMFYQLWKCRERRVPWSGITREGRLPKSVTSSGLRGGWHAAKRQYPLDFVGQLPQALANRAVAASAQKL
jgi:hypothetical protein